MPQSSELPGGMQRQSSTTNVGGAGAQKADTQGDESFDFLPSVLDDTFPVYSGLFNEIISSSMARVAPTIASEPEDD